MLLRKKLPVLLLCMVCVLLTACSMPKTAEEKPAAYTVTDIEGTVVDFPAQPQRIVTLSMSTDETMLGLVEPERIVAVNGLLDDPVSSNVTAFVKGIPRRIGSPTVEEIMALQPDLVVVPDWGDLTIVPSLREAGLKVVVCKGARNLAEIRETVTLLAAAVGEPERGQKLLAMMDEKLAEIRLMIENTEGVHSYLASDHIINLLQNLEGHLDTDKLKLLGEIDKYFALKERDKKIYQLARRNGMVTGIKDLKKIPAGNMRQLESIVNDITSNEEWDIAMNNLMDRYI